MASEAGIFPWPQPSIMMSITFLDMAANLQHSCLLHYSYRITGIITIFVPY
jgi:hypothetical protein